MLLSVRDVTLRFGGIVALNRKVDAATAAKIAGQFVEAVIAPADEPAQEPGFASDCAAVLQAASGRAAIDIPGVSYREYLMVHGLSVEMTEALAEYWHWRIRDEWGFADEDGRLRVYPRDGAPTSWPRSSPRAIRTCC